MAFANGGWLQLFADPSRAGRSSVTLTVDDLDAHLAQLEAAGIDESAANRAASSAADTEAMGPADHRDPQR